MREFENAIVLISTVPFPSKHKRDKDK